MIENIIFDLCGSILSIDIRRIDVALQRLGTLITEPYLHLYHLGLTKRFESGQISTEEFCEEVRQALDFTASNEGICNAWNSLVASVDHARLKEIAYLHQNHHTFLLSNSDEVNAQFFVEVLNREAHCDVEMVLFDKVYFSYRMGLRKPDPAIFQRVLEENGLKAEETLLIDDCKKHCLGAESIGIKALLY